MIKRPVVIGDINILRSPHVELMSCIHPNRLPSRGKELYMMETTVLQESVDIIVNKEKRRSDPSLKHREAGAHS